MKNEQIFIGQIEDKIRMAQEQYVVKTSVFLDNSQYQLAVDISKKNNGFGIEIFFDGGYEDAERKMMFCIPEYSSLDEAAKENLTLIRVSTKDGGKPLRHGDYLGSLTGLGLNRNKIGDILVRDTGADVIVSRDVAEFIMTSYAKAGKSYLELSEHSISELIIPEKKFKIVKDTVASARLDNIVASAFGLGRSKAQEAIRRGLVFLNGTQQDRTDFQICENDKIVIRGRGKAVLKAIGNKTRKDRIFVEFERYI